MKECFNVVKNKILEGLSSAGYALKSEDTSGSRMVAVMANAEEQLKLEYNDKLFTLYRGAADEAEANLVKSQTYLFDKNAGDGVREAAGVANEFLETLQKKAGTGLTATQTQRRRKDKDSDENDAIFFVNRIATVLPECREPLNAHKKHYEQMLPRYFCEEVVVVAQNDMIKSGDKAKLNEYCQLLATMYTKGDLDTRSIIMQVLLGSVDSAYHEKLENCFDSEFVKAWAAARKFYGRNVRPEKKSAMAKLAAHQAETLNGAR